MIITITTDVQIDNEFTVQTRHVRREGKSAGQEYWQNDSYNASLSDALRSIVKRSLVQGEQLARVLQSIKRIGQADRAVQKCAESFISSREAVKIEGQVFGDFPKTFWS